MSDLKHRIYAMGKELQLMNVATVSPDNKPRVRYVVGKMDQELNLVSVRIFLLPRSSI